MNKYSGQLQSVITEVDPEIELDSILYFQEDEIALHHWENRSVIVIRDSGCIDAFVDDVNGIRLDPDAKSQNFFASKINLFGRRTHLHTDPYQLIWNKWQFNPEIYEWCRRAPITNSNQSPRNFKLKGDYEYWDSKDKCYKHAEVLLPPYYPDMQSEYFSIEVKKIIDDLGFTRKEV